MSLSAQGLNSASNTISGLAHRAEALDSAKPFAKDLQALEALLTQLVQKLKQEPPKNSPATASGNDNQGKTYHGEKPAASGAEQKPSTASAAHTAAADGASTLSSGNANDNFLSQFIEILEKLLAKLEAEEAAAKGNQGQGQGQAQGQPAAQGQSNGPSQDGGNSGQGGGGVSKPAAATAGGPTAQTHASHVPASPAASAGKLGGKVAGSCDTSELKSMGKVTSFKESDYGPELAANKKEINASLDAAGATKDEKAMVMSMFMVETSSMKASQRDSSKDGNTDGSKNFSALNLNESMLAGGFGNKKEGVKTFKSGVDLNDPANIGQAAVACLEGMRQHGAGAWLAGQRGGGPAAMRHAESGTAITGEKDRAIFENFYSSVLTGMEAIKKDPALMTDSRRVEPAVVGQYLG